MMNSNILFVDDEQNVLDGIRRQLLHRYDVSIALGGKAALDLLAIQGPFAIVVADMRMPQMNGIEFLIRVRQNSPDTIRMMLTGNADRKTAMDAVALGEIYQFLTKPCDEETLCNALDAGLKLRQLQSQIQSVVQSVQKKAA